MSLWGNAPADIPLCKFAAQFWSMFLWEYLWQSAFTSLLHIKTFVFVSLKWSEKKQWNHVPSNVYVVVINKETRRNRSANLYLFGLQQDRHYVTNMWRLRQFWFNVFIWTFLIYFLRWTIFGELQRAISNSKN